MRVDTTLMLSAFTSPFHVVHVGQSAVVLQSARKQASGDELLIISPERSGLMPGGVCLAHVDFHRVRADILSHNPPTGSVLLAGWSGQSAVWALVNLNLAARAIPAVSVLAHQRAVAAHTSSRATAGPLSPEPIRLKAPSIAQSALAANLGDEMLSVTIGAGPGTTPSGDDVIVGIFAGLHVFGLLNEVSILARQIVPFLPRTTLASRHYLKAAMQGRFGQHVHDLVDTLAGDGDPDLTVQRASQWGATSGVDLLVGLVSVLAASMNTRSVESAA